VVHFPCLLPFLASVLRCDGLCLVDHVLSQQSPSPRSIASIPVCYLSYHVFAIAKRRFSQWSSSPDPAIRKKNSRGHAALPWCASAARGPREKLGHAEMRVRTVGKQKCNAHSMATHAHAGWPKATYSRKMTDSTADVGAVTGSTETAPPRAGHQREVINYIHGRKTQPRKKRPPATNTPHKPREATPRWPRRCPRRPSSTHRSKWPDRYGC
jgi:hypothetical protein